MAEITKLSAKQTDNFLAQRRLRESGQPQLQNEVYKWSPQVSPVLRLAVLILRLAL